MVKEYLLRDLDCANCAAKIETEVRRLKGIKSAHLNFATTTLKLETGTDYAGNIEDAVKKIVSTHEPDVNVIEKSSNVQDKTEKAGKISFKHISLVTGTILFVAGLILNLTDGLEFILFLAAYLLIGWEVLLSSIKNISKGQIFDENFLMAVATIGAFAIKEYPEAAAVMLFYQIGELFQSAAVGKSRKSITELMNIRPEYANVQVNGQIRKVSPADVKIGDIITVRPGEKIPLDGVIINGESALDTSALTGESAPRHVKTGDTALSGCINKNGVINIRVQKKFNDCAVSKILDLVEKAAGKKAPAENFITAFAKYYTPAVVAAAGLVAVLPPLLTSGDFYTWINRALIFLVVSCPCALVVSIPLSFFGGIGAASKNGVLIKGGNYLSALSRAETVVFDKTGTLTAGEPAVTEILPQNGFTRTDLIKYAAYAEAFSTHPLARAVLEAYGKRINTEAVSNYNETLGYGVTACAEGKIIVAGNEKLMAREGISYAAESRSGTKIYVGVNGIFAGTILIADKIKEGGAEAVRALKKLGVKKTVMLTGDNAESAASVAKQLRIDDVYSQLLPDQKVALLEEYEASKGKKDKIIYVGDGINDAPVLAMADIGVAMGALGSDAAIEAADVVLMNDNLDGLVKTIKIAKKTRTIVLQNIIFALGVKAAVLILGAAGISTMWEAVFADVGVTVIAVLNSMRILASRRYGD